MSEVSVSIPYDTMEEINALKSSFITKGKVNMSESLVGIVEEVVDNGKGKGSHIRVAGHKYGSYDPADQKLDEVAVGTTVSFRYKEKDGGGGITYKNIQGPVTTVKDGTAVTAAPVASSAPSRGGFRQNGTEGGFPLHARCYERALDRRNALNAAVAALDGSDILSGIDDSSVVGEAVIELARAFEAYTTGDDIAEAEAELAFKADE